MFRGGLQQRHLQLGKEIMVKKGKQNKTRKSDQNTVSVNFKGKIKNCSEVDSEVQCLVLLQPSCARTWESEQPIYLGAVTAKPPLVPALLDKQLGRLLTQKPAQALRGVLRGPPPPSSLQGAAPPPQGELPFC